MRVSPAREYPNPDRFAARSSGHRARFSRVVAPLPTGAAPRAWLAVPRDVTVEKEWLSRCAQQAVAEWVQEEVMAVAVALLRLRRRADRVDD